VYVLTKDKCVRTSGPLVYLQSKRGFLLQEFLGVLVMCRGIGPLL
jgi:hypothetical protein